MVSTLWSLHVLVFLNGFSLCALVSSQKISKKLHQVKSKLPLDVGMRMDGVCVDWKPVRVVFGGCRLSMVIWKLNTV